MVVITIGTHYPSDTEHDDEWVKDRDNYGNDLYVCHTACPSGTLPVTAAEFVTLINDVERESSFRQIEAATTYDGGYARKLGVTRDQYVASHDSANLDPSWFTVVTVTMACRKP